MIALAVIVLAGIGQLFNDDDSVVTPTQNPTTSAPVTETDQVEVTPSATTEEPTETSSEPQAPSPKAEPEGDPWAAPTDGTWDRGDYDRAVAFGDTSEPYGVIPCSFRIVAPPSLTPIDGKEKVTMSSTFIVESVGGSPDTGCFPSPTDGGFFEPGYFELSKHTDGYGETKAVCQSDSFPAGEPVECVLSFTAPADEIEDSYWTVWGNYMGAWPSQTTQ